MIFAGYGIVQIYATKIKTQNVRDRETQIVELKQEIARLQAENEWHQLSKLDTHQEVHALKTTIETLYQEKERFACEAAQVKIRLEEQLNQFKEKEEIWSRSEANLLNTFKALSSDALKENQKSFLELAQATFEQSRHTFTQESIHRQNALGDLFKPLQESLEKVDQKILDLEKSRISAYASLIEQIKSLHTTQIHLQKETAHLSQALRNPTVRGRWGEIQLKRVVEMAGMLNHCDFLEQVSLDNEERKVRPDLIINLPNGRQIVIDAKAPLQAYLEGIEYTDESLKAAKMKEHARHLRRHLGQLSDKTYWSQLTSTPEFVVLFLPGDVFFNAALEHDPSLIEYGVDHQVLLATPTTLIALLRAVAYGWKQQAITEHAEKVHELGKEMHERLIIFVEHFCKLKKGLEGAVESYNKALGCLESRVLVSARRFKEMNVVNQQSIPHIERIEKNMRLPYVESEPDMNNSQEEESLEPIQG